MRLENDINALKAKVAEQAPLEVLNIIGEETNLLAESGAADKSLKAGDNAPAFSLPNSQGTVVSSQDLLAKGPLVVAFYRGGWWPFCSLELQAWQRHLQELKALEANLVAISPEVPERVLSTTEQHALGFQVLSDMGNVVARKFGLVFTVSERLRPIYESFGIDLPASNGDHTYELPMPATFLIDRRGKIAVAFVDADYTKRMEPEEAIAALKEL